MRNFSYIFLNIAFVGIALLIIRFIKAKPQTTKTLIGTAIIAYGLMLVFNTYLTSLAIVRYDWQKVLGVKILSWPIEDLAYLVVALYIGPALWSYFYHLYDTPSTKANRANTGSRKPRRKDGGTKKTHPNSGRIKTG